MFSREIQAYRQRRQQGTRRALNLKYFFRGYFFAAFFVLLLPLSVGIDLSIRHHDAWRRALGVLLLALVVGEIALLVRWLRLPLDPEALERRNAEWVRIQQRRERIPDRSKW